MRRLKDTLKEKIALLRIRQGDAEAFGFLYDSYVEKIFRYVAFRVSDRGAAHDIVQDIFLDTWEYVAAKKPVDNFQSFLYRVAYHKVVDFYREKERQTVLIDEVAHELSTEGEQLIIAELHVLKKSLDQLKPEYQDVIALRFIEGLSVADISGIMGKERNAVRVLLHRALGSLKHRYQGKHNKEQKKRSQ